MIRQDQKFMKEIIKTEKGIDRVFLKMQMEINTKEY